MQRLYKLYEDYVGRAPDECVPLAGAGSNRRYYRLSGTMSMIGTIGDDIRENEAFVYLSNHFVEKGFPVPRVYGVSDDGAAYIQDDFGDTSLFDLIQRDGFSPEVVALMKKSLARLAELQYVGVDGLDASKCYPRAKLDGRSIMWDLNYFKYCFLKSTGIEFSDDELENDFESFKQWILGLQSHTFMYRDFQSRNIMICDDEPKFIDFQGGRIGPAQYDLVSFLWQARAGIPVALREELIDGYVEAVKSYVDIDEAEFRSKLPLMALFRTLQVLGAYGFRGYVEHKSHFIRSILPAVGNLRSLLENDFDAMPYLIEVLRKVVDLPCFAPVAPQSALKVNVYSFSYKKGVPVDYSGNGGGFVFDCRAIHNPGRYEQYKKLTGLDDAVIDFLEENGEVSDFLENAYSMVDHSVKRYIERGFTNLSVCFGCTGGRHRSVYCAQHLAQHLSDKFGVRVELNHRERGIVQLFEAK